MKTEKVNKCQSKKQRKKYLTKNKNLNSAISELFSKARTRKSSWKMYWISNYVVKVTILLDNISVSVSNFSFNGGEYFDGKKVNITKNITHISFNFS